MEYQNELPQLDPEDIDQYLYVERFANSDGTNKAIQFN